MAAIVVLAAAAPRADAAVACPNPNPVVDENQCHTGTAGWQVGSYSPSLGGFATQTSTELGDSVTLKIARNAPTFPAVAADIAVYRIGYYRGIGARLVNSRAGVTINNDFTCNPMDPATGKVDCGNWAPTYTIPGSAFPASGVYLAKVTASTGEQTHIVFTVRDDARLSQARMLFVLPMADYTAYNTFGGKSLYFGTVGDDTASGTGRAVKVSFNRPLSTAGREKDWFFGPDYNTLYWLERQGYDISYTDDVAVHRDPQQLLRHIAVVIPGHSEYWSLQEYHGLKAARDAGVSIASFSANTAYWKVRYEDGERTLVCYKTVEGGGSNGNPQISDNDWGPDGVKGTADDALGADGRAGTADDHPENATTTWRDNGAPPGDANAPAGGRVGPNEPENSLWGVMYVGDNDSIDFPLTVPAGNANGEFASDRVWRSTGIATNGSTAMGTEIVGWEWDAVPTQAQYLAFQPAGVKRVSATNVQVRADNSWLQDEGRARTTNPPPGQPGTVNAVKYTAPSGALVFAGGTNQWGLGLADDADARIQQATYNVFSDMGIQPDTPDGVTVDAGGSSKPPIQNPPGTGGGPPTGGNPGSGGGATPGTPVGGGAGAGDEATPGGRGRSGGGHPGGQGGESLDALRTSLRTQVARALGALQRLGPSGVRRDGLTLRRFRALTAGNAVARIVAPHPPKGADPVVLAAGRTRFAKAGTGAIELRVTEAGAELLRDRIELKLRLSFRDRAGRHSSSAALWPGAESPGPG